MATKKTPAPRRAGNTNVEGRAAREVDIVNLLERWRGEDPVRFTKAIRTLVKIEKRGSRAR